MNSMLVDVVAAAVFNSHGEVLIALRAPQAHQGGLWEFPGGKIEPDEPVREALARELYEEVGITVTQARPLITVVHHYPDKSVRLRVWRVDAYTGEAHGREGQAVAWARPADLYGLPFPAANLPIIAAVNLPDAYLITPAVGLDVDAFLESLGSALAGGIRLVQLRDTSLALADYASVATLALALCRAHGARLLLNAEPEVVQALGADGVQLSSARLHGLKQRPLPKGLLVAASCHGAADLAQAALLGVDFAVLSPVCATRSHPETIPLGWPRFAQLCEQAGFPVYALGGMTPDQLDVAFAHGAQGIAAIGGLWPGVLPKG